MTPFLQRFAQAMAIEPMPPMRLNPVTQISEVLEKGQWRSGLESPYLGRGTKTGVKTESTDHL
jgi:hypothetical protein